MTLRDDNGGIVGGMVVILKHINKQF